MKYYCHIVDPDTNTFEFALCISKVSKAVCIKISRGFLRSDGGFPFK